MLCWFLPYDNIAMKVSRVCLKHGNMKIYVSTFCSFVQRKIEEKAAYIYWLYFFSSLDIQIAIKFHQSASEHLQREGMKRVWREWRGPNRPEFLLSATSMTKSVTAWSILFILFWIFLVIDTSNGANLCIKVSLFIILSGDLVAPGAAQKQT